MYVSSIIHSIMTKCTYYTATYEWFMDNLFSGKACKILHLRKVIINTMQRCTLFQTIMMRCWVILWLTFFDNCCSHATNLQNPKQIFSAVDITHSSAGDMYTDGCYSTIAILSEWAGFPPRAVTITCAVKQWIGTHALKPCSKAVSRDPSPPLRKKLYTKVVLSTIDPRCNNGSLL